MSDLESLRKMLPNAMQAFDAEIARANYYEERYEAVQAELEDKERQLAAALGQLAVMKQDREHD